MALLEAAVLRHFQQKRWEQDSTTGHSNRSPQMGQLKSSLLTFFIPIRLILSTSVYS